MKQALPILHAREISMSVFEDDRPRPKPKASPGEDLSLLSLDELRERIALYREEIGRLERDIAAKQSSRASADAFFKK